MGGAVLVRGWQLEEVVGDMAVRMCWQPMAGAYCPVKSPPVMVRRLRQLNKPGYIADHALLGIDIGRLGEVIAITAKAW